MYVLNFELTRYLEAGHEVVVEQHVDIERHLAGPRPIAAQARLDRPQLRPQLEHLERGHEPRSSIHVWRRALRLAYLQAVLSGQVGRLQGAIEKGPTASLR